MNCRVIKDKNTGEEYLIPGCWGVLNAFAPDMTDREIIKTFCNCNRSNVKKYEVHTKDEVILLLTTLENKIRECKDELELSKIEEELDCIKSEVFMLNTVEVVDIKPI